MNSEKLKNSPDAALKWREACFKHGWWFSFCLIIFVIFEIYLWQYPPKGYESKDVLNLGEAGGEVLVDFTKLWDRILHDDKLMLEIIARCGCMPTLSKEETLFLLENVVRRGLSYRLINPFMAEITFSSQSKDCIRPFLTTFTAELTEQLKALSEYEYGKRLFAAKAACDLLARRRITLQDLFDVYDWPRLLEPMLEIFENLDRSIAESSASSTFELLGRLAVDSVAFQEIKARQVFMSLTATGTFLRLFNSVPTLLTDRSSPPQLVMPAAKTLLLLLPIGLFFIYMGGVILLESSSLSIESEEPTEEA